MRKLFFCYSLVIISFAERKIGADIGQEWLRADTEALCALWSSGPWIH